MTPEQINRLKDRCEAEKSATALIELMETSVTGNAEYYWQLIRDAAITHAPLADPSGSNVPFTTIPIEDDDNADIDGMENEDAIAAVNQCDRIIASCDDIPEAGEDFADSVRERVSSFRESIKQRDRVTENQQAALDNMENGVSRWIDRSFDRY